MNGISLLLLLSSLGATTGVELNTSNQPVYTIRIESLLINELRAGQTIPILVAPKDRGLRHFKIAMTPDGSSRNSGLSRASDLNNSRAGDLFDYEPTQLENGEIEYVVQISPERLESLAAGKAIEGDIAAEIAEVDRYLIFVNVGQLPSQQRAAALAANGNASPLRSGGNKDLIPAGAESRTAPGTTSRNNAPSLARAPVQSTTQPSTQRGFLTNDSRTNFRNQPDQSTVNPPPFANWPLPTTSQSNTLPRSPGLSMAADRNAYVNQQPPYPDPNAGYAQQNSAPYPQQPGYGQNFPVGYPQQAPTLAARNEVPPAQQNTAQPTTPAWAPPPANNQTVAQSPTTTPATAKIEAVPERPWTPLILTTLALFASMGANAYLGWLSWSFFWRFRDAVTEAARARANHSSSRQAA